MRMRVKGLLWLGAVLIAIAALPLGYLLAVPWVPTGYAEVEKLRQADVEVIGETPKPDPPKAASGKVKSETTPVAQQPARPAPRLAETPRQRFARCWAAVMNFAWEKASNEQRHGSSILDAVSHQSYSPYGETTIALNPAQWKEVDQLTTGTLAYEQALRRVVAQGAYLNNYRSRPGGITARPQKEKIALAVRVQSLQEAVELLRLPAGAIPELPAHHEELKCGSSGLWSIAPAYLHALAHEPGFDAVAGLRRAHELRQYARAAVYPNSYLFTNASVPFLLEVILAGGLADNRTFAALVREAARLSVEARTPAPARSERLRRYEAQVVRDMLLKHCDGFFTGAVFKENAFHFFLNGTPERLWIQVNEGNVRRHIDLLAVAIAKGDQLDIILARSALARVLKLSNINQSHPGAYSMTDDPMSFPVPILRLAIAAYGKDHGALPRKLAELWPTYLPESFRLDPGSTWWIDTAADPPLLVQVRVEAFGRQMREIARDERKFQAALAEFEKTSGRKLSPREIEDARQSLRQWKDQGARLHVMGTRLERVESLAASVEKATTASEGGR